MDVDDEGQGYFEIKASQTKTLNKRGSALSLVPMVGSATGVSGLKWAERWIEERRAYGLNAENGPLLTALGPDGKFSKGKLRNDEAVIGLHRILEYMGCHIPQGMRITMHSLKALLLSWCGKAGVPQPIRKTLGYHVSGRDDIHLV